MDPSWPMEREAQAGDADRGCCGHSQAPAVTLHAWGTSAFEKYLCFSGQFKGSFVLRAQSGRSLASDLVERILGLKPENKSSELANPWLHDWANNLNSESVSLSAKWRKEYFFPRTLIWTSETEHVKSPQVTHVGRNVPYLSHQPLVGTGEG